MSASRKTSKSGKTRKSRKTAKDYSAEALARCMDEWRKYDADTEESLDEWLKDNLPSKITRQDGIGWISVENPRFAEEVDDDISEEDDDDISEEDDDDIPEDNLLKDWENLIQNGQVNFQSISELAKRYQRLTGRWMIHVLTGDKVDLSFRKLANELVHGVLADIARHILVSPLDLSCGDEYRHVILISHSDFTNVDEVFRLERLLRDAGIKTNMLYKPDIYGTLGIYRNNEFGMRPTIYSSDYDVLKRASKITITHDGVFETGSRSQVSETDNSCELLKTGSIRQTFQTLTSAELAEQKSPISEN